MTVLSDLSGAVAFRATADPVFFDQVPVEARDTTLPNVVHWRAPAGTTDPFAAGALWGLSWALETVFGEALGSLLAEAALSNVQTWTGTAWSDLA